MSMKNLAAIDRFYLLFAIILLVLSALAVFTFKRIFFALNTAKKIDEKITIAGVRLKKDNLDKVYEVVFNKKIVPLDLGK